LVGIYAFLKSRGFSIEFIDTQFGDYNQDSLGRLLREKQFDVEYQYGGYDQ
jgi:hypothetical protein